MSLPDGIVMIIRFNDIDVNLDFGTELSKQKEKLIKSQTFCFVFSFFLCNSVEKILPLLMIMTIETIQQMCTF